MAGREYTPQDHQARQHIVTMLNDLKKQHNYTQKDITEATGISQALISHYLTGKRNPSEENLEKLADFFGLAIEDIDPRYRTNNIILGDNNGYNGAGSIEGNVTINNTPKEKTPPTKPIKDNRHLTDLDILTILGEILRTDKEILKTNKAILNKLK